MNRRSGFTLMELLLVVAVLAIVAAAAAPTFFGGATQAMTEARKASLSAAYSSVVSNAFVQSSIALSKGETPTVSAWTNVSRVVKAPADGTTDWTVAATGYDATNGIVVTVTGPTPAVTINSNATSGANHFQTWLNSL